jgi:predicted DNA-binding protein
VNRILRTVWLEKGMVGKLANLSRKTRIPQAVFMREAVDLLLKKYEKQLSDKQKRGKMQNHQMDKQKILKMVPKLRKVKKGSR